MRPGLRIHGNAVRTAALLAMFAAGYAPLVAAQAPWKPDKAVEIVVGSSPGGGNDRTARTLLTELGMVK